MPVETFLGPKVFLCDVCGSPEVAFSRPDPRSRSQVLWFCRPHAPAEVKVFCMQAFYAMLRGHEKRREKVEKDQSDSIHLLRQGEL